MNEHRGLWRGKCVDNGKWIEGYYVCILSCHHYIYSGKFVCGANEMFNHPEMFSVEPSTLGMCTGLSDRNGKLIFEGDILKYHDDKNDLGLVCFGDYGFYKLNVNHMGFYALRNTRERGIYWGCPDRSLECAEIIGNIHDGGVKYD